jgi:NADH-quinone oxidoreductase subunit C
MTPDENAPGTTPQGETPAEAVPPEQKLADPAATGKLPSDPAASVEKPAEAAASAPEGAQPTDTPPATEKAARPAAERPARPAREAEPKEAPRVAPPAGSISEALAAAVPDVQFKAAYTVPSMVGESVCVEIAPADVPAVLGACHDDARLDLKYLRSLSGVDWQEQGLEVVYHLLSIDKKHHLTVKTRVSYEDASVPSIAAIYPAADWHERETRDMFGIDFPGHWNLVPLLLPEDMTDHFPLRKDNPLQEIEEWQGENLREGAGEGDEE